MLSPVLGRARREKRSRRALALVLLILLSAITSGCAVPTKDGADANGSVVSGANGVDASLAAEAQARRDEAEVRELNRQLGMRATAAPANLTDHDYRLGPGDVVKIEAPQAPEINGLSVRISGPGTVNLPLVGEMRLGGLTTSEGEQALAQHLGRYIHTPQVSLFVSEFASQEITVTGAVASPGVIPIQRPRSLFEILSMAGGLAANAGSTVNVQTQAPDPVTGQQVRHNLIVDLRDLVTDPNATALVLRGGDSVYVPEAGVFFVDGAVARPGSYPLRPEMTVLKAIAVAGGTDWAAVEDNVRVIRRDGSLVPREIPVDLESVRDRGAEDMVLQDGDVVVVDTNQAKRGAVVMWDQTLRVLSLGVLYR
jgi:polysaccharide export outer membrane protein